MTPEVAVASARALPTARAVEAAAKSLDAHRNGWLYPANLVKREPEVVANLPERIIAIDEKAAHTLAGRTLTALYNNRPSWLVELHRVLDEAVAQAYGWPTNITTDEALRRLFDLNLERSAKSAALARVGGTCASMPTQRRQRRAERARGASGITSGNADSRR